MVGGSHSRPGLPTSPRCGSRRRVAADPSAMPGSLPEGRLNTVSLGNECSEAGETRPGERQLRLASLPSAPASLLGAERSPTERTGACTWQVKLLICGDVRIPYAPPPAAHSPVSSTSV